ncbi:bifunctional 5,10-methylenetetrahydrofolate dehydrogenase/5,10-methenyltetrahydrofolate cyclohydrolase [Candidatus Woesearchaeota archaeon]|nr:bifunctional 5,10-methylenetetrahydrofolate dehydrogenase/5,10-methenyltetrahydrofolate cyclohydrolase [Candidatus Woesearchaeota archaeon]
MPAKLIDGKKLAEELVSGIKKKAKLMKEQPGLAFVMVGNNPASEVYVGKKERMCKEAGFYSKVVKLPGDVSQDKLLQAVEALNQDPKIHGFIVQLPLPKHISESLILETILPYKDADGFSPVNLGFLFISRNRIIPATPKGVMKLIHSTGVDIEGKHAVILGRSNIVGKPVAQLLLQENATVTICHSKTQNIEEITRQADILVAAIGNPRFVKKEMVKKGAIVIDVGTTKVMDKLMGDVYFEEVKEVAGYLTPVPGGVGPMTVACLLENTLECMELQKKMGV